jgi:multidrug efflux pump subunit AcrB
MLIGIVTKNSILLVEHSVSAPTAFHAMKPFLMHAETAPAPF